MTTRKGNKNAHQIARIRSHLDGLEYRGYSREARLTFWRLIISSAHDAHEQELLELESLSVPMADPALEVPIA